MLTESEKRWLKERNEYPEHKFCHWCPYNEVRGREDEEGVWCSCDATYSEETFYECLTEHYYFNRIFDAIEFEQRVTAKLAYNVVHRYEKSPCINKWQCMPTGCVACWLRQARLQVEEEMDGRG